MANPPKPPHDVKILPPDRSLQQKVGLANLDHIFSLKNVEVAQEIINRASEQFLKESLAEAEKLEIAADRIGSKPGKNVLNELVDCTFSLKAKAGLGGYDLVSLVAKSLHQYCGRLGDVKVTSAHLSIIKWHVESIKRLLALRVKGLGGPIGEAIIAELNKLDSNAE